MPYFDLPLEELKTYKPDRNEPADFDAFWQRTLAEARTYPLEAMFELVKTALKLVDVYDVSFNGYGGQPIKGWYLRPAGIHAPLPCVVEYIGYGGGRGFPHNWLVWPNAGYAVLAMDVRGQGSGWRRGDTPDKAEGAGPFAPGFMTQGIEGPETYYYRRVYTDAARAVEAAISRPDVDKTQIAVTGGSQGGGITIAAAALAGGDVAVCMADVPFLCHFRRAVGLTNAYPYQEVVQYLVIHRSKKAQVFNTLAYFDGMNFAPRIKAACLFSTGLMDEVSPPSTVFATFNHLTAEKQMVVYDFNQHEGGADEHLEVRLAFLAKHFTLPSG